MIYTPTDLLLDMFDSHVAANYDPALQQVALFLYKIFNQGDDEIRNLFLQISSKENFPEGTDILLYCLRHKLIAVHSFFVTRNKAQGCSEVEANLVLLLAGKSYLYSTIDISPL